MSLTAKPLFVRLLLILSLGVGLVLRLKDFQAPLADWHSWRQTDTASVAVEYVKHGIDLLHPRYQDLSAIPSGKENPEGYRMVEFPLVNGLVAWLYRLLPIKTWPVHVLYRLVDIIFSLISAVLLYRIVSRLESPFTGYVAALVFLILPYNIFYSRTILPEVAMVTATLAALDTYLIYTSRPSMVKAVSTGILAAVAMLIKPVAAFFLLPLLPLALSHRKSGFWLHHIVIAAISTVPLLLWRWWIGHFPEGIPASDWLLNGNGIRFKGAFFQWLFADRLGRLILGYWGLVFLALGAICRKKTNFITWWTIGALIYVSVFATGNVQHDYYQIPLIPVASVLVAYGIQYLRRASGPLLARYGLILVGFLFMEAFGWYQVRGYFNINNPAIVAAGRAVDTLVPADALVIAPYQGDTAFLYQTNRRGWPIGGDISEKIKAGADYYVSTNLDAETKELMTHHQVIQQTSEYVLIKLDIENLSNL